VTTAPESSAADSPLVALLLLLLRQLVLVVWGGRRRLAMAGETPRWRWRGGSRALMPCASRGHNVMTPSVQASPTPRPELCKTC
jgi:hypothetical protein